MRVLVCDPIGEAGLSYLRQHADVDFRPGLGRDELLRVVGEYDALVVRSETRVTREVIEAGERLQVIGRAGVGVDNIDVEAATRRGVVVVNAPIGATVAAAEHTVGLLLALARNIPQADASLRDGKWNRSRFVGVELRGKLLGVVGLGRIGSEVARRALALQMQVVAHDPFVSPEYAKRLGVALVGLEELLRQSDFISLHTPLSSQTRGLIGPRELALVKPTARIINSARGGILDEEALAAALEEGRVAGAALDVFAQEPPRDSRLLTSQRVVVTPHLGASTVEAQRRVGLDVAEQVVNVLRGEPAQYAVNAPITLPETMAALAPYLGLAQTLGSLFTQLVGVGEGSLKVTFRGEIAEYDTTPLKAALIKGLLQPVCDEHINLVNAAMLARSRGLELVEEKSTRRVENFANLVGLRLSDGQSVPEIAGTVIGGDPHIVRIDGYWVDIVPAGGYLLLTRHADRPGLVPAVVAIAGRAELNIAFLRVARTARQGEAMTVLGIEGAIPPEVFQEIRSLQDVREARVARL